MTSQVASSATKRKAILFSIFIAFGGFLFGYDIGVISGCLGMPDFIQRFGELAPDGTYVLSSARQSIIVSLLPAGCLFGSIAQTLTVDRFGRKWSITGWSALFVVATAIQTGTEHSVPQMSIGRFIAGVGVGALSGVIPLYNGETAPKQIRGMMIAVYATQLIFGIFFSTIINLATHTMAGSASWRIPLGLQMVWGLILVSGVFFLPESPRHLLAHGKQDQARKVIAELNCTTECDALVSELIAELQFGIDAENEGGQAGWLDCFSTQNSMWKRTVNGIMLQALQQLHGENFYTFYGVVFFQSAGTTLSPYGVQAILIAVSVVGTIPGLFLVDSWGRRKTLLAGAALQAPCALITGLVGHYLLAAPGTLPNALTSTNKAGGNVIIVFAVLQLFFFSSSWSSTPWAFLGESTPLRLRSKAIALGCASNWIWTFLISFFSPRITARIDTFILLIFFGCLVFSIAYVYVAIPETKGLSLEEVDEMYRSGVVPWRSAGWKPSEKVFTINLEGVAQLTKAGVLDDGASDEKKSVSEV